MRSWLAASMALPVLASACDRHRATREHTAPAAESSPGPGEALDSSAVAGSIHCKMDPSFPSILDVPEASAAAEVEMKSGTREILVVSDSDRKGAALAYALPEGPARALTLPLDPRVADDSEGIAWLGGHLYVLISIGYLERFTPNARGELIRDQDAYPLGAPPFTASWSTASSQPPDFEGLCLRAPALAASPPESAPDDDAAAPTAPTLRCDGYAASRAYGWLVCLLFDHGRLRVNPDRPRIALDVPKQSLSDCAFGAADGPARDTLLVTTNIRGGSTVSRVDEATGRLTPVDVEVTLNNEAIAVDHDGRLYEMMDPNAARSPALRATCTGW